MVSSSCLQLRNALRNVYELALNKLFGHIFKISLAQILSRDSGFRRWWAGGPPAAASMKCAAHADFHPSSATFSADKLSA